MLHTLNDALLPAANWILELQDIKDQMKSSLNLSYSYKDIMKFRNEIARPFYCLLKDILYKIVLALETSFSIFDPKLDPKSPNYMYGNEEIKTLLYHYGRELPTKTIASEQFTIPATISSA